MTPENQKLIQQFTLAAKAVIYEPSRMKALIKMMNTRSGSIQAVQTVMAGIEKQKPIPPEIAPMLAVNIFMLLVDVAQRATGHKPKPEILQATIQELVQAYKKTYQPQAGAPGPMGQPPQPMAQPGLLAQGA